MNKDLEFHYVVAYREGFGWYVADDTEEALFSDGTVYNWKDNQWIAGYDDEEEHIALESLDFSHYTVLKSALDRMNGGM